MAASARCGQMVGLYPWGMHLNQGYGVPVHGTVADLFRILPVEGRVEVIAPEIHPSQAPFVWGRYVLAPMYDPFYDEPADEYIPAKMIWKPGPYGRMCYQFYGSSDWRHQNFRKAEAAQLYQSFPTFDRVKVGIPMTLGQIVDVMLHSDFFVGIDSGMTHLARCVGIPTFVNPNRVAMDWFYRWHKEGSPSYTVFRSVPELHAKIRQQLPGVLPAV